MKTEECLLVMIALAVAARLVAGAATWLGGF